MCLNMIYLKEKEIFVPCRNCSECKKSRAEEWAVRLWSEMKENPIVDFVTLTYRNSPLILIKKEVQSFIKRLRRRTNNKIKYFACGEYGDKSLRPHFHLIIYNCLEIKKNMQYLGKSKKGHKMYNSPFLEKVWTKGFNVVQNVTFETLVYTALYQQKTKNKLPRELKNYPEFNLMSRNLGYDYISKNIEKFLETDEIWINGQSYPIPTGILNKLYVKRDSEGRIIEKDEVLVKLKEDRKEKYYIDNRDIEFFQNQLKVSDRLLDDYKNIGDQARRKLLCTYYKNKKELIKIQEDNKYRASKKKSTKSL